jgi:plastocyanin
MRDAGPLPANRVTSTVVKPGEEVRWIWTHTATGSYVSGYAIAESRARKGAKPSRAKRQKAGDPMDCN